VRRSSSRVTPKGSSPAPTRTGRLPLEQQTWVLELAREMRAWAKLQQFGTMLEAVRTAAREHRVPLTDLQVAVSRVAVRHGIVRPLPVFPTVEAMQAADAAAGLVSLPMVD